VTPLVSVCIPAYNAGAWLDAAIASIRGQSLRDLELVIVDDGSTDDSPAIIARHAAADARIVARRIVHAGMVGAANEALACARAPLVARLDADDIALPDRLERQLAFLEAHGEVAALGGAVELMDRDGRTRGTLAMPERHAEIGRALMDYTALLHPTMVARTAALREIGGYRPAFAFAEDRDMLLRLAERAQLANLPDVVTRYRRHADSVSLRHIERQAVLNAAAVAAARLRRSRGLDPCEGAAEIDAAMLAALELTPADLHRAVASRLHRALRGALAIGHRAWTEQFLARLRETLSPAEYLALAAEVGPMAFPDAENAPAPPRANS